MMPAGAAAAVAVLVLSAALAELDLSGGAEFGDERVHRATTRFVAEKVLDLVVDVDERLLSAALLVRLVVDVLAELL